MDDKFLRISIVVDSVVHGWGNLEIGTIIDISHEYIVIIA